jgi:hypothetical protein
MQPKINNLQMLIDLSAEGMAPRGVDAETVREMVDYLARLGVFSQSRVNRVLAQHLYAANYSAGRMNAINTVADELDVQPNTARCYLKRDW